MTVVNFPKRLPSYVVNSMPWWEQGAYRRGTSTVTIETELAVQAVKDRCRAIMELPEIQIFGKLNNALSRHLCFETTLSVEEARAETIAIRTALAEIGIPGMAITETEKETTHE